MGKVRKRVKDGLVGTLKGTIVRFFCETSAFLLRSSLLRDWFRAILRHRITLVFPRFSTFASLIHFRLFSASHGPVGWGYWMHRLLLSRGVRPQPTSVLDMTLNNAGALGKAEYPFIAIADKSTLVAPEKGPIYELNRTKPWFLDFTIFCI